MSSAIALREEPFTQLALHAAIPSVYESSSMLDVVKTGDGHALQERSLLIPYRKNYDLLESPLDWPAQFDVSNWVLIGAYRGAARIGGAIAAFDTPGVDMLEGRSDLVVLWDLRVSPEARRRGVASALFRAIESIARRRRCRELKVETQNTNIAACRLYASQGCELRHVRSGAYPDLPDEVQLIWKKGLSAT